MISPGTRQNATTRTDHSVRKRRWLLIVILSILVLVASGVFSARSRWYTGMHVRVWPADPADPYRWILVLGGSDGSFYAGLTHRPVGDRWVKLENYKCDYTGQVNRPPAFGAIWQPGGHTVFVRCWFVGVLSALIGAYAWRQYKRPAQTGMCDHCGYDLRATPDRCPECGTVPAAAREGFR
jgi:hypothetical protein